MCRIVRAYINSYRLAETLTHDGILISGACVICKASVVADRSPTNHRVRALHFVARQGEGIIRESRICRCPWFDSTQSILSHCLELCMAMPKTWMFELARSFFRTFGCGNNGDEPFETEVSILCQAALVSRLFTIQGRNITN